MSTDETITCPQCRRVSHHPDDIKYRYCGMCGFHSKHAADLVAARIKHDHEPPERLPKPAVVCPVVDEPTLVTSYTELVAVVGSGEAYLIRAAMQSARAGLWLVPHPEYVADTHGRRTWREEKTKQEPEEQTRSLCYYCDARPCVCSPMVDYYDD